MKLIESISARPRLQWLCLALALAVLPVPARAGDEKPADPYDYSHLENSPSRLSDEPAPLEKIPEKTQPPVQFGDPFLGQAEIGRGWRLPTGAVWNPALQVFGTYRTAVQSFDAPGARTGEWAHRFDVFANLFLTGTERILIGFRPIDRDGAFTSYRITPEKTDHWKPIGNNRVETLFMEGDIGELFPIFDPDDSGIWDFGFSVGRQPFVIQDGQLIDDTIDAVGLVRNTLRPPGTSNLRITGIWGWNEVHRGNNLREHDAQLFGIFTETDFPFSTVAVDAVFVKAQKNSIFIDSFYGGISATQRIGLLNSTIRVNTSIPTERESTAVSRGTLLFLELAWTFPHSENFIYLNAFWGINEYQSAARGADRGGPLGRVGILFAAVGLGRYGSPLGNIPWRAAGGALGVQIFPGSIRRQIILEVGGRQSTDDDRLGTGSNNLGQVAAGIRVQQAIWTRFVLRGDAYYTWMETGSTHNWGGRVELVLKL